jgi:hypothetical protein
MVPMFPGNRMRARLRRQKAQRATSETAIQVGSLLSASTAAAASAAATLFTWLCSLLVLIVSYTRMVFKKQTALGAAPGRQGPPRPIYAAFDLFLADLEPQLCVGSNADLSGLSNVLQKCTCIFHDHVQYVVIFLPA